ncbi:hypothetical protein V6N13_140608 [Hibiscus sabdariffa]|uniref:Uncharacterized protein n=2 Tax=Hibiscus sabdariffa TaxID=183260 RepID=A0ABR2Q2D9_9ROSI
MTKGGLHLSTPHTWICLRWLRGDASGAYMRDKEGGMSALHSYVSIARQLNSHAMESIISHSPGCCEGMKRFLHRIKGKIKDSAIAILLHENDANEIHLSMCSSLALSPAIILIPIELFSTLHTFHPPTLPFLN